MCEKRDLGFKLEPRRWDIERTFARLGKQRSLNKDYVFLNLSEAFVHWVRIALMLKEAL
ncbi:transposase [Pseudanabaena sp. UWO311]|nr:transposase [Pseudanabaena sp. UWO311]